MGSFGSMSCLFMVWTHIRGRFVDDRTRTRGVLTLLTWWVSLGVAVVAFTRLGADALAPPVTDPAGWGGWAADRDAVVATAAVLRLAVLAMAWYLLCVTTLGAMARVVRWTRLVRVADALSVAVVRRVLRASLGAGLATTVVVSSTGVAAPVRPGPPMAVTAGHALSRPPAVQPVDVDPAPDPGTPADLVPPGVRPLPTTTSPSRAPFDPATVVVEVGDHLWGIAERHVGDHAPRPTTADVTTYWRRLVDANRDRLVDPDDPDLILPGQRFVLPSRIDPEVSG